MNTQAIDIEIDWNLSGTNPGMGITPETEDTIETPVDPRIAQEAAQLPLSTWAKQVEAPDSVPIIAAETAVLAQAGIGAGKLAYEAGTALAVEGHAALKAYDAEYKALPGAGEAGAAFKATIDAERRADHDRDLATMRITTEGRLADRTLALDTQAGLELSPVAWRQLAEIAGGQNVNKGLAGRKRAERMIRTRSVGGPFRQAHGIVSGDRARGYTVFDGPQVMDLVCAGLRDAGMLSGARMDVQYEQATTRYEINAIVQAPIDVPAFNGVGRVHRLFAKVSGGDDGMTSVRGQLGAIRVRCLNATLVQTNGASWTKTHRGQASEIRALVAGMVANFGDAAKSLCDVWQRAAAHHYLDTDGSQLSVQEALGRLVDNDHIPTGGLERDAAVDHYLAAWRAENTPTSAAGILMAVQRAAHESTWKTRWATTEIEEAASNLLYQPVWNLAEAVS